MSVTIGTTSYGYRYQLLDAREAPPLAALVRQARAAGLEALQICENARPLDVPAAEWRDTVRAAARKRSRRSRHGAWPDSSSRTMRTAAVSYTHLRAHET